MSALLTPCSRKPLNLLAVYVLFLGSLYFQEAILARLDSIKSAYLTVVSPFFPFQVTPRMLILCSTAGLLHSRMMRIQRKRVKMVVVMVVMMVMMVMTRMPLPLMLASALKILGGGVLFFSSYCM